MEAKELLRNIFKTSTPEEATKGKTGETLAKAPEPQERPQGDYLPVIAVLVGVGLIAVAALGLKRGSENPSPLRDEEDEETQHSENDW